MKQEKTAKPSKKASAKRVRKKGKSTQSTTSQVSGLKSPGSSVLRHQSTTAELSAQIADLQKQLEALRAAVEPLAPGSPSDAHRAPLQTQPASTSIHSPVSGFGSQISESAPQVSALRSPVSAAPATATEPAPSEIAQQVATLSEQVSALRSQLSTLDSRPSTSASSPPSSIRYPSAIAAKPPATPPLVYELKQTQPVGHTPANLLDSTTEESEDGFYTGLFDRARIQWLMGDWEKLSKIDLEQIKHHPDCAKLAIMSSLGRVQIDDKEGSKKNFLAALKLGVNKKLAISLLYQGAKANLNLANQARHAKIAVAPGNLRVSLYSFTEYPPFNEQKNKDRWKHAESLKKDWDGRTISLAKMIPPNSTIIEFGAGRCILKNHLPPDCEYTPSDLYDRGKGTIVMDLNGPDFKINKTYNYAVLSGVLEYIIDVERFIKEITSKINNIVMSYAIIETNIYNRKDWANHYNLYDILKIFEEHGYTCVKMKNWKRQMLFHFQK